MAAKNKQPEMRTKSVNVRIDLDLLGVGKMSTYIIISGVPEDLPEELEGTVIQTAEAQIASVLNQRKFLELYELGKSAKDGVEPTFYNLDQIDRIKVVKVQKVN